MGKPRFREMRYIVPNPREQEEQSWGLAGSDSKVHPLHVRVTATQRSYRGWCPCQEDRGTSGHGSGLGGKVVH